MTPRAGLRGASSRGGRGIGRQTHEHGRAVDLDSGDDRAQERAVGGHSQGPSAALTEERVPLAGGEHLPSHVPHRREGRFGDVIHGAPFLITWIIHSLHVIFYLSSLSHESTYATPLLLVAVLQNPFPSNRVHYLVFDQAFASLLLFQNL